MSWEGRTVLGRGDYILSSDRDDFIKAGVREARLNTDHQIFLTVLRGEGARQNLRYLGGGTKWPLAAPTVRPQTEEGAVFASLKGRWNKRSGQKR